MESDSEKLIFFKSDYNIRHWSVKMIARIAHCLNGYVRAMAFAGVNSENVTKLAVAGSSGAVQEFHLKFDVDENIVRCVVLDQVEALPADQMSVTSLEYHPDDNSLLLMTKSLIVMVLNTREKATQAAICAHDRPITSNQWLILPSSQATPQSYDVDAMDIDAPSFPSANASSILTSSMDGTLQVWDLKGNEIMLRQKLDLKGVHDFKPIFGAGFSRNKLVAIFFSSPMDRVRADTATPEESQPRLGFVPLDISIIEPFVASIIKVDDDEVIDWDLRRFVLSQKEPPNCLKSIFELLFRASSGESVSRLRAAKLLVSLSHFQTTSIKTDSSFHFFDEVRPRVDNYRVIAHLAYFLDCIEGFVALIQESSKYSDRESQSVWNMYQWVEKNSEFLSPSDLARYQVLKSKMSAYVHLFQDRIGDALKFHCIICDAPVSVNSTSCPNDHPFAICTRTLTPLDEFPSLRCIGCDAPALPLASRAFKWQRLQPEICPLCGHRFREHLL